MGVMVEDTLKPSMQYAAAKANRLQGQGPQGYQLIWRPTANLEVRREFFSNRVVDEHNRLPETVTLTPGSLSLREILPQEDGGALCQP